MKTLFVLFFVSQHVIYIVARGTYILPNKPKSVDIVSRFGFDAQVNCSPINQTSPDFGRLNLRSSETQCLKYMWDLKQRADMHAISLRCDNRKSQNDELDNSLSSQYPHMGAIGWDAYPRGIIFKCGCSLISDKFILTSARCIKVSAADTTVNDPSPKIIRFGAINIEDTTTVEANPNDVKILKTYPHPLYKPTQKYNDIALVELTETVMFSRTLQPACLWNYLFGNIESDKTLVEWRVTVTDGVRSNPKINVRKVEVVDSGLCNRTLEDFCNRRWCGVKHDQICIQNTPNANSCMGFSGCPLQMKINLPITTQGDMSVLLGMTSFGVGCDKPEALEAYTAISPFIPWIENIVWPNNSWT